MSSTQNEWISKAEDIADRVRTIVSGDEGIPLKPDYPLAKTYLLLFIFQVTRSSKHVLPHLARFCLVSTFFEDGIRMWVQWSEQREYMDISWGCGWFIATLFVVLNLIGQLGGVTMVLLRFKVDIACGVLFGIVALQVHHCIST